ncbi:MAG: transcriptional repressor [Ruminococcus sp.]|nr:transcriptional repressor [Ruminococcus sp.]
MAKYNTVQRDRLLDFLYENKSRSMTVAEITASIKQSGGKCPAESTVYRLIKELVAEGVVKRTVNGIGREFLYQLVDDEGCREHLHMKCKECGRMLHMDKEMSEKLINTLSEHEGFCIDRKMVLTGVCSDCAKEQQP